MAQTKKLLILTTGGTIVGNVASKGSDDPRHTDQDELAAILKPTSATLSGMWGVSFELSTYQIADVDSSDITPQHWTELADRILAEYDHYDGFIVTHGTNTMGYTCAALSFALDNLNKPVVVTGSQIPYGEMASDAQMNLENALRVALYPYDGGIRGVVCVFGSHIITGTRVKKETEFDLDAFTSFSRGELGRIGRIVAMQPENLLKHHSYQPRTGVDTALLAADLSVESSFATRILSFTEFPGLSLELFQSVLKHAVEEQSEPLQGLVFRAFGAGDVSTNLHPCFEYLRDHEIPVVVTTQAPRGNANFRVNVPGETLAKENLAIPAHDMSIESITTKLSWLLAKATPYSNMK